MAIGVFGLQVAYRLKRLEVMSLDDTYGWFGGGRNPASVSIVDRIDFSNDTGTANIRGSLSLARDQLAATGNSNYGWFGGGSGVSTVDRIDFSSDSSTASVRGSLSEARQQLTATGNSNYGWFGGGFPTTSTVDRIDFSNDSSTASPRGPLSVARFESTATGNSNYGWFCGGKQAPAPSKVSTVDRIDFSNDSPTVSVRGPLSAARGYVGGATGNSNYGWFGGGDFPQVSIVDRIDFSNDSSTALIRGPLSSTRYRLAATGNSNYGWFGVGSFAVSIVDRIDFSNDSATASIRGPLSVSRRSYAATSGQAKGPAIKLQKAGNFGWFDGGASSVSIIDRIDFSNDSVTASPRGLPSLQRQASAATGNSNYGWFGGGTTPTPAIVSTVDRIDFSNDSSTASVRGPLSSEKSQFAATGNSNYGWFGGGLIPGPAVTSVVERINFSNDSATASPRSLLSAPTGIKFSAATGNSNYGWFGGGTTTATAPNPLLSTVDRIDFSNDSSTVSVRGPLFTSRLGASATGNSNYGWFGGGQTNTTGTLQTSRVERINFSNDSATASVRGPLTLTRQQSAATGNSNYGWFGGGSTPGTPGASAIVNSINFSNDLSTASVRGPIFFNISRANLAATSNSTR
jgi:hypothetical protein